MKLIVCDDNERRRERLVSHLRSRFGSECVIAQAFCSDEVAILLAEQYFDSLVLDIVLPKRVDNKNPSAHNGIQLLRQICQGRRLNKPERIIALTGYIEDLSNFRQVFSDFGVAVVEANEGHIGWEETILNSVLYTAESQSSRSNPSLLDVVSVHGIRTYGEWQNRLSAIITEASPSVQYHPYKYGYFSAVALLVPSLRQIEVARMVSQLTSLFSGNRDRRYIVFCHSFGTFIVTKALEELCRQGYRNVGRLVLSGSVLPCGYDWRYLIGCGVEIVNDCAQDDIVLWVSEAFVLRTGMGGKVGFLGLNSQKLLNRFIKGGHSSYFFGDSHMRERWLPLIDSAKPISWFDERVPRGVLYESVEAVVRNIGKVKGGLYILLLVGLVFFAKSYLS